MSAAAKTKPASAALTVTRPLFLRRQGKRVVCRAEPDLEPLSPRRPARVAKMLAFAYRVQGMIDRGDLKNRAAAAAHFGLTRPRVTQIMALLRLAPDIQREIAFLEWEGVERITERSLRPVVREADWARQREKWCVLRNRTGMDAVRGRRGRDSLRA